MTKRKPRRVGRSRQIAPLPDSAQARAFAKVGSSDVVRLSWLLNLLNLPLGTFETMTDAEFKDLNSEVDAFCGSLGSIEGGRRGLLTVEVIEGLSRDVRALVEGLLEGASGDLQIPAVILSVIPNSECRYIGSPDGLFRLAAGRLLEKESRRIRRCARLGCGRLFAHRKRGLYCGRRCSQLVQFTRYVERHSSA